MFKRRSFIFDIVLLLLAALLLTGCGGDEPEEAVPEETSAPTAAPLPREAEIGQLRLTEVMAKNRAVLQAEDGSFPDWVELTNTGDTPVQLSGWSLSDKAQPGWQMPERVLAPGERLVIYADGSGRTGESWYADFALNGAETVYLYSPNGYQADALPCCETADHAMARDENGEAVETRYATPGFENTTAGYEAFQELQGPSGPLCINEAVVANFTGLRAKDRNRYDWVELKNCSDETLELSDYYLSDKWDERTLWRRPAGSLAPGETVLVICSGEARAAEAGGLYAPFKLDAADEELFLSTGDETLCDHVYLHDIPTDGSMGRLTGSSGWFYYAEPSPGKENPPGARRVTAKPVCPEGDGVWDGVESVTVTLSSPGEIHYTLDCSVPTADSPLYTGPLTLDKTTIVRAVAVEAGCLPSRVLTLSYFINEDLHLPVLSLVANNHKDFVRLYNEAKKYVSIPGSLSFYEESGSFTMACGISMKGWTSLELPKRSMGVDFGGYGDGDLRYDLFGNGVDLFGKLSIRAGQDYLSSVIRNELCQELCLETGEHALTQSSRYCVLFIDGKYYGVYCLKENLTRQYYASHMGIDKQDVEMLKSTEVSLSSDLWKEVFEFARNNDMSAQKNYEEFCRRMDIDNLIDWTIMEAFSNNTDINGNMRYFRDRNGGKWQIAYYDLDWSFLYPLNSFQNVIYPSRVVRISEVLQRLLANEEFRMKLARRTVELCRGVLSNEHVLQKIDELEAQVEPEMVRDKQAWGYGVTPWQRHMRELREYFTVNDYDNYMIRALFDGILRLSAEQQAALLAEG